MAKAKVKVACSAEFARYKLLKEVGNRYCRGQPMFMICTDLGLAKAEVVAALVELRDAWLASALLDFNGKRSEELAKIDHMESRCWVEFDKSCGDEVVTARGEDRVLRGLAAKTDPRLDPSASPEARPAKAKLTLVKRTARTTRKGREGNTAFLDLIKWCIEARVKLLNLGDVPGEATKPTLDWDALFAARPTKFLDPAEAKVLEIRSVLGAEH